MKKKTKYFYYAKFKKINISQSKLVLTFGNVSKLYASSDVNKNLEL